MPDAIKFRTGGTNNYQSCGIFSESFLAKPSSNSDSSKDMFDEVYKFQACETSVSTPFVARDMKSPYICSSLLAERDYSINSKHCDTSVTSSMHKDPFAATFKKEVVNSGEEVYGFLRIFGEDEKKISTLGIKCSQISSSIIKTEPDVDNVLDPAGATAPFSAKVKSLAFLVIGPYRSGKSFLLNQLLSLSCYEGFGVGHMCDTKTKGIWVWGTPIEMNIGGANAVGHDPAFLKGCLEE